MKKNILVILFCFYSFLTHSQQNENGVSGGFESNAQWYLNDKGLKDEFNNTTTQPEDPVRSNNYLFVNYLYKKWSFGIQGESYTQNALLNMNPKYNETNVATYFARYQTNKIDITAGYYYEQFGSGLLLRAWEDRALGINNALRGVRVIYKPAEFITMKYIYGQQRTGFDVANSKIYGIDFEFDLKTPLNLNISDLTIGWNYIGRYENLDLPVQSFDDLTNAFSGRINFSHNAFYINTEVSYKLDDAVVQSSDQVNNRLVKPGNALLMNTGYSKKGFGIDATFRRLENMSFFSERGAKGNNFNDRLMNYIPSLTKQQHYNLANIYVYQAQPGVFIDGDGDEEKVRAGEIGGQLDLFYDVKKGTLLGGKNGIKIAVNLSNWNALSGTFYILSPQDYQTDFLRFGKRYYTDVNFEVTKKWNSKWLSAFSYVNQYYNKNSIGIEPGIVYTDIVAAEATYKFMSNKSIRVVGEHMWASDKKKNWASATVECNLNSKYSFYAIDLYNYGNELEYQRNHYYNFGGSYRYKSTRIALSYGRQRGGLVCVGGVCRNVPESSGISLSLNTSF